MANDRNNLSGNTDMLLLKLLSFEDMYGYQIIDELAKRSNNVFELKAGTLYPLLHQLESKRYVESYDTIAPSGKARKYYHITKSGRLFLESREKEWNDYTLTINRILRGGVPYA